MDISIVVVNWNTREFLRNCLASTYSAVSKLKFEVIVVDNGSTDGSLEMVAEQFPEVRVIANPDNRGFAEANNQGIELSRGRHVLLLNSDAILLECSAELLVHFLDQHPHVGIVGGQIRNPDGSFQSSFADFADLGGEILLLTGLSRWLLPSSYPSYPEGESLNRRSVDWLGGAFIMVRREATRQVGNLDSEFFMYVEEMDWCFRMKKAGWSVWYLPEARAVHWSGGSSDRVPERKRAQLYRSKYLFMRKHRGQLVSTTYVLLVRLFSALKLFAWHLHGLNAGPDGRERSRQHVNSYRYLLTTL